ncbi:hypothetical protein HDU93_009830 [Gonapodya sp. JEL0774]|nr:hypothetical protein HDU93_009830 [Gonapodya sp. JEL0774]
MGAEIETANLSGIAPFDQTIVKTKSLQSAPNPKTILQSAQVDSDLDFSDLFSEQRSVDKILRARTENSGSVEGDEDAFFVCDLGSIVKQYVKWNRLLPRVKPFYAVKCNPDRTVVKQLVALGAGFDCASRAEIETVLALGVSPSEIIYANPCKQVSHLKYAAVNGVKMLTFDNADELRKVKKNHPEAELILRVLADDSKSLCKLGLKFGASPSSASILLRLAKELDLNVVGVSFHVGSGCFDATAFRDAVITARKVFDEGEAQGFNMRLLDIGGGFPGADSDGITFEDVATSLAPTIDKLFPPSVKVIAEPGRYFVSAAFTLAVNVVARRVIPLNGDEGQSEEVLEQVSKGDYQNASFMYYINDGMYGSFNNIMFDHAVASPKVLKKDGEYLYESSAVEHKFPCSLWGPTCDSIDCIAKTAELPVLDVGDWLYFSSMGAYTLCAASNFNGFRKSSIVFTQTETRELRNQMATMSFGTPISDSERQFYGSFWNRLTGGNPFPAIQAASAASFLSGSRLSTDRLAAVWEICNPGSLALVDQPTVFAMLRCIAALQNGVPDPRTVGSQPLPLPKIEGFEDLLPPTALTTSSSPAFVPQATAKPPVTSVPSKAPEFDFYIAPSEKFQIESQFTRRSKNDYVLRADVEDIYHDSRLPRDEYLKCWDLVDYLQTGRLNETQFVYFYHLVSSRRKGKAIPETLPDKIFKEIVKSEDGRKQPDHANRHEFVRSIENVSAPTKSYNAALFGSSADGGAASAALEKEVELLKRAIETHERDAIPSLERERDKLVGLRQRLDKIVAEVAA